jgi:hypothetical protein
MMNHSRGRPKKINEVSKSNTVNKKEIVGVFYAIRHLISIRDYKSKESLTIQNSVLVVFMRY